MALLNTDYELDKVIYIGSGSFTVPVTFSFSFNVPHSIGLAFLGILQWSHDPNFSYVYGQSDPTYSSGAIDDGKPLGQFYNIIVSNSEIAFSGYNNSGGTKTVYWRVIGFFPSGTPDSIVASPTAQLAKNSTFNTDYRYMSLIPNGRRRLNYSASTVSSNHNLGYIPVVLTWGVLSSGSGDSYAYIGPESIDMPMYGSSSGVVITDSQVQWVSPNSFGDSFSAIEIRIYRERMI